MSQTSVGPAIGSIGPAADTERTARYVYCVAAMDVPTSLGPIGIEGHEVYVVVHRSLGAVVHDCPPKAYDTKDRDLAAGWVLAHHRVVEAAWVRWGTVLPLTFNTIINPPEVGARDSLAAWLDTEHDSLRQKLEALAGKAEYGVQVFWDTAHFAQQVAQTDPEVRAIEEQIASQPRGLAYMYRQKLEGLLKKGLEARAATLFQELFARLAPCMENVRVEKSRKADGERPMLMNLSCLVAAKRLPALEAELDKISQTDGLSVRLTGPWPPYSFC